MTALSLIFSHWRVLVAVAACLLGLGLYALGKQDGYQDAVTDQLQASIKAERERAADDAKLRDPSDYDFCRLALQRRGLPIAECDQLRGVSGQ